MTNEKLHEEIANLTKMVEELSAKKTEKEAQIKETVKNKESELVDLFKDVLETVEKDVKTTNPLTMLVIFLAGIITGRLLPK